jgi:two-component system response regulator HydG
VAVQTHVLVIDDDESLASLVEAELAQRGYRVTVCMSAEEGLARIDDDVDVVLTDFKLPHLSGAELCARVLASRDVPVLVMTAFGSLDRAVAAMRAGVYDFVTKPLDVSELVRTLNRAVRESALRREARRLRRSVATGGFQGMIGSSPAMIRAFALVHRVADGEVTALVTGESGTGKELVARAIHERSLRAAGPFVAINCAALPESLLESELFGHTRGAFTDARRDRRGLFLEASRGTLFLDELGEMPLSTQAKLLRALQERRVRPVGGDEEVPFDARVVAATNSDLEAAVAAKTFREDLFYRVNVVRIDLPPLRARGRDVLDIAGHVLRSCQPRGQSVVGFTTSAIDALLSYPWPGNVRELRNAIQYAVALAEYDHIGFDDLPPAIRDFKKGIGRARAKMPVSLVTVAELERRYIAQVLKAVDGNKTVAARILGFDRRTLYRRLEAQKRSRGGRPPREPPDRDGAWHFATGAGTRDARVEQCPEPCAEPPARRWPGRGAGCRRRRPRPADVPSRGPRPISSGCANAHDRAGYSASTPRGRTGIASLRTVTLNSPSSASFSGRSSVSSARFSTSLRSLSSFTVGSPASGCGSLVPRHGVGSLRKERWQSRGRLPRKPWAR